MALNIIPHDDFQLTDGEKRMLNKIKRIYETTERECYLYVQPRIRNLNPDYILVDSLKGVCIIEIKDWSIEYLERVTRREAFARDGNKYDNPIFKANKYYNLVKGVFLSEDNLLNDMGELKFKLYSKVVFTNLSSFDIESNNFLDILYQPPSEYITSDSIQSLKIDELFNIETCNLENSDLQVIRSLLFPEVKVSEKLNEDNGLRIIKALDAKQEKFAKKIPYGHYMITGVPGSGKTVILITRALYLAERNPDWKIRIVTYNKALSQKIELRLKQLEEECTFMNIHLENISVATFHKTALDIANIRVPKNPSKEWWDTTLPSIALERAVPTFDAILIDEYQDFYEDWLKVCIKICKNYSYKNSKNEQVEGINLFLAGDRLQSIYNPKETSWKSLGIDMRGRSELLKKTYRTGKNHINLALDFLMLEPSLKKEVENFYEGRTDIDNESNVNNEVKCLEGNLNSINMLIRDLLSKCGYKPNNIIILCKTHKACEELYSHLDSSIKNITQITKEPDDKHILITTYHSAKGLEAPVCILTDASRFKEKLVKDDDTRERKLLYVGMTRASERLYIHAKSFSIDSFAKQLQRLI
ncbi:AAA family ATPase [Clostridium sp. A1-XYC3]|uniref:DNA 3'-5' helicase n=1 Tax=Clostridium tanneri TaxID=3037988 RepID=A0ABU4JWG8_9CLOT|nr:UvrD-helicase domain-containing protein [Clostridium sp. A1-XYC3]MDW8802473.1 AAA family ATPase [Clostridium sp. A1-XYC3]